MHKRLTRLLALSLCLGTAAVNAHDSDWEIKKILVLHSYEPSYQWTSDIQSGIEDGFQYTNSHVKLSIEYLDAKRVHSDGYFQKMANYLEAKYQDYQFDGIIISDDAALLFAEHYLPNSRRETPLVAVGINNTKASLDSLSTNGDILYEYDRVKENVTLINRLRPKIKNLYYLADRSLTSELIYQRVKAEMAKYPRINLIALRDETLAQASSKLSQIDANDAVLLTHFNTELDKGIYHSYQDIAHDIGLNSAAPVFVLWEMYLNEEGILGGFVNRSKEIGQKAAELMSFKLGVTMQLPTDEKMSEAVLDYAALQRYDINRYDIPESAHIINTPPPTMKVNLKLLLAACAMIVILSLIIVAQFAVIRHRKEIDRKNRKIVSLQKRTLTVQKEMITVLGEAIESRSGETGQHVKRVARLSSLLAKLYGLSHREIELIEIISPMHDVGKISIPESILEKPGKLTAEEWEIMKQHTVKGYELLNLRSGDVTQLAAIVAHQHHERWDGTGYPSGLAGNDIHIFARIVSIVDVFDALLNERCYKPAWSIAKVSEYLDSEKGHHFDPELCQLVLDNLDDFMEVRVAFPDNN
ncbi:HD domain-containing phosphohydrolase [Vibrio alfacsensis]|uniref:HD domain-containing phosphohydrolase n=1 Tax=Vibrio alfacsensis TaxID=1074311 RepID=UPI001BF12B72|nr:HD domain-containing phosphohydrolase [Vibrio alfacsensis]BCN26061.1 phosphodiesterase [Vibrio alfacsensis]